MTDKDLKTILERLQSIETKKGSERAWDIAGKILVPLAVAGGAWLVGLEIRTSRLEDRMDNVPPKWLKDDVTEIKATLKDIEARIRKIENGRPK